MTADGLIRVGFLSQLVLLALLDWGTLSALSRGGGPSLHYVGLAAVNAVLLSGSVIMWRWLVRRRDG